MNIDVVLMDIEGTTTAIDFVHKTLFPYAARHLPAFVAKHGAEDDVRACLEEALAMAQAEGQDMALADVPALLLRWIEEDRKAGPLKRLQGMIWRNGYETGAYTAHIYDDVVPAPTSWRDAGKRLAIYSSGSIAAQKLLFRYSQAGDLTPMLSAYFDTTSGHKREEASYRNISRDLGVNPGAVLFLSDVPAELDAARAAGMQTTQLVRPGTQAGTNHSVVSDFAQLKIDGKD